MSTGLDRIAFGWGRFDGTGSGLSDSAEVPRARFSRTKFLLLPLALMVAAGTWLAMSGSRGGVAESDAAHPVLAAVVVPPPVNSVQQTLAYDPFTSEAVAPEQPSPLDKLRLLAQSWHRGGLGSNAQVSFILRNLNDYAVKDVEIACTFARRDGHHLTDRARLVPGVIDTRSRKSFERLHIGFVNVNASKAKCALVSASRT